MQEKKCCQRFVMWKQIIATQYFHDALNRNYQSLKLFEFIGMYYWYVNSSIMVLFLRLCDVRWQNVLHKCVTHL